MIAPETQTPNQITINNIKTNIINRILSKSETYYFKNLKNLLDQQTLFTDLGQTQGIDWNKNGSPVLWPLEIPVVKLLIKKLSDDLEEPQFKSVWVQPQYSKYTIIQIIYIKCTHNHHL